MTFHFSHIRIPTQADLPDLKRVVAEAELFPVDMLDEMIMPFLHDPGHPDQWLVCEGPDGRTIGFAYFRPEPLTKGTWNLLAIGFLTDQRGRGYGTRLLAAVEEALKAERILIVETSGLEDFEATRRFYVQCGYRLEATIRDYWAAGDDKVIFRKRLA